MSKNFVKANGRSERRYFIGGSDARIIMGDDETALGFGAKNVARSSQGIYLATSSSSLVR